MAWLLLTAIVIRLATVAWSVLLLWRLRDWRLAFLTLLIVLMLVPLLLVLAQAPSDFVERVIAGHAIFVSLILLLSVIAIGWILDERNRLYEELSSSEARYRALAESAQDVIFVIDSDDRVQYVNATGARQLGKTAEAIVGRARAELFPPEVSAKQGESLRTVFETKMPVAIENRIVYPGGARWLNTVLVPLHDSNGEVPAVLGVSRDMTARKHAEQELAASRQRLAMLSRQLIAAQETERRRLAHELHDEIGQVLTAVHISLQQIRAVGDPATTACLDESDRIINRAIGQVRDMSLNLRPAMLDDFGLPAALRWFLERPESRDRLQVHFHSDTTGLSWPTELRNSCFRIVQEAVTNVLRHAQANNLWVQIAETSTHIELTIRDDGVGFDLNAVQALAMQGKSFGILGMQERVELHGGNFEVDSQPNQGSSIHVRMPILTNNEPDRPAIDKRPE